MFPIEKIISGGQTGVDRAALDVALELGIPRGGWCPKGRKAEDGPIDPSYPLLETASVLYRVRTEKNVRSADGTLVLTPLPTTGGTALTLRLAQRHRKPFQVADITREVAPEGVQEWVLTNRIRILNVAGPRESEWPGIYSRAFKFLLKVLAP